MQRMQSVLEEAFYMSFGWSAMHGIDEVDSLRAERGNADEKRVVVSDLFAPCRSQPRRS